MAISNEQIAFVTDLFCGLPAVNTRKMFGGLGIYSEGKIFAIIGPEDQLFLKAKGQLASDLAQESCRQWVYDDKPGKPSVMPYWTLPESALDDPEEARHWAKRSLAETA